jgi:hypothetical protein
MSVLGLAPCDNESFARWTTAVESEYSRARAASVQLAPCPGLASSATRNHIRFVDILGRKANTGGK